MFPTQWQDVLLPCLLYGFITFTNLTLSYLVSEDFSLLNISHTTDAQNICDPRHRRTEWEIPQGLHTNASYILGSISIPSKSTCFHSYFVSTQKRIWFIPFMFPPNSIWSRFKKQSSLDPTVLALTFLGQKSGLSRLSTTSENQDIRIPIRRHEEQKASLVLGENSEPQVEVVCGALGFWV